MPIGKILPSNEVVSGAYKFVKVAGEYRFAGIFTDHSSMVDKDEKPQVQSAGSFSVDAGIMFKGSNYSMTLNKACSHEDFEEVAKILGAELRQGLLG